MARLKQFLPLPSLAKPARAVVLAGAAALFLTACQDSGGLDSARAYKPIPRATLALMAEKGTDKRAPMLVRAYKKEGELEIWKMRADGTYAHLKTYPICRWSGQLGPKRREGDRQVPEGFYSVAPGQMNPNSAYYLSFNVGYPNAYDRSHGFTGSAIMVHGACSSAGCFSMTDEQMAEIFAIARESFAGGQRAIQVQSLPFRFTPENLARYRLDPNMKFWNEIREGVDYFEVTKREPEVAVCGRRYVFNATPANGGSLDANAACPPLRQDEQIASLVAEKRKRDEAKVAELVANGVRPVKLKFQDGGQHPSFAHVEWVSRPEALAQGPVEIPLDVRPTPAAVRVAAARATPTPNATSVQVTRPGSAPAAAPAEAARAFAPAEQATAPFYMRWLGLWQSKEPAPAAAPPQATPTPSARTPAAPGQRNVQRPEQPQRSSALPDMIRGAQPVLPEGLSAYAPTSR
jgi:murein L,D-transpeptidase YafK